MLTLSEELFKHLRDAVSSQRSHSTTKGNHPPPPAVELEFTRQQSATEKVGIRVSPIGDKIRADRQFLMPSHLPLPHSHLVRYTLAAKLLG
jgi:hypothetical protein